MASTGRRYSRGQKLLIGFLILIVLAGVGFQVFMNQYIPPMVRSKMSDIIIKSSDSLYRFDATGFNVNYSTRSIHFANLHIRIDSNRYLQLKKQNRLPQVTYDIFLPEGYIDGIRIWPLIFRKDVQLGNLNIQSADVKLYRHFKHSSEREFTGRPLWKMIQPGLRSIQIGMAKIKNLKLAYHNADGSTNFNWQFEQGDLTLNSIRVDSLSTVDKSRLGFIKDIKFSARSARLNTEDGLYQLRAGKINYFSSSGAIDVTDFNLHPSMSDAAFVRKIGYQHEVYRLKMPKIRVQNFILSELLKNDKLKMEAVELRSPVIAVSMNRNAKPNPNNKRGKYPNQLLLKSPLGIDIRRLSTIDGLVEYSEMNQKNQLTGRLIFPGVRGTITNITNDPIAIRRSPICIADIQSGVFKKGLLNAIFRFNLADKAGAFTVNANIKRLDAEQLFPIVKAMASTDLQSFNLHNLDYTIKGNENRGTGKLRMKYNDMDILINQVEPDGSLDKKGLISFFANRAVIYKENPMNGKDERIAENIAVTRDPMRSFFNFIWTTLSTSAGKIILRPRGQRKLERRKERTQQELTVVEREKK